MLGSGVEINATGTKAAVKAISIITLYSYNDKRRNKKEVSRMSPVQAERRRPS